MTENLSTKRFEGIERRMLQFDIALGEEFANLN